MKCFKITMALICTALFALDGIAQPPQREGQNRQRDGQNRQREGQNRQRDGQDRPGGPGGPGGMQGRRNMMAMLPLMKALDKDADGTISADEIKNATAALLTLDKNNDGKLDRQELRPDFPRQDGQGPGMQGRPGQGDGDRPRQGTTGRPGAENQQGQNMRGQERFADMDPKEVVNRMFTRSDKNNDGKLSGDEIPERMQRSVQRIDTNGDGAIQKEEMIEAMNRRGQGGNRGGQKQGDGLEGGVKPKRPKNDKGDA